MRNKTVSYNRNSWWHNMWALVSRQYKDGLGPESFRKKPLSYN